MIHLVGRKDLFVLLDFEKWGWTVNMCEYSDQ